MTRWAISLMIALVAIAGIYYITSSTAIWFGMLFDDLFQIVNLLLSTCLLTLCIRAIIEEGYDD